jgi:hypothetical protein
VLGDGSTVIAAGVGPARPVAAIDGTGSLTLHQAVQVLPFGGAPKIAPGIVVTTAALPSLRARGAPLGGAVNVDLFTAPNDLVLLWVGGHGGRLSVPGFGDLWLDPSFLILSAVGLADGQGRFGHTVPVPLDQNVLAARFAWQGLSGSWPTLALSNVDGYVHD